MIICLSTSIDRGAFKLANEGKRLRTFEKHFFVQRAFANRHKCFGGGSSLRSIMDAGLREMCARMVVFPENKRVRFPYTLWGDTFVCCDNEDVSCVVEINKG